MNYADAKYITLEVYDIEEVKQFLLDQNVQELGFCYQNSEGDREFWSIVGHHDDIVQVCELYDVEFDEIDRWN